MRLRLRAAAMTCLTIGLLAADPAAASRPGPTSRRATPGRGRPELPGARLRDATRSAGTATATATGCRSTAPTARPSKGLTHEEILDFYYPGTSLGHGPPEGPGADLRRHHVRPRRRRPRRAARSATSAPATTYALPRDLGATRWRVVVDGQNRNVVAYFATAPGGRWQPGGDDALRGRG